MTKLVTKGLIILIAVGIFATIAAVPFIVNDITQPQTQYLAGFMVLIAATLAYKSAYQTRLVTKENDEREHLREIESQLRDRFVAVSTNLGSKDSLTRHASIYSLAALADDWARFGVDSKNIDLGNSERKVCINLICSYLQEPKIDEPEEQADTGRRVAISNIRSRTISGRNEHQPWKGLEFSLDGADLSSANFAHASLERSTFIDCNLQEAILDRASLKYSDFTRCNLQGASMVGADVSGADFTQADLSGVDFRAIIYDGTTKWPFGFSTSK